MSIQPVSMLMSNLNLESAARVSPNALAAAQDTGQSQEIIREGIRAVQTVQASEAAAEAQRVHRKDSGSDDEGQGRQNRQNRDSFIASKNSEEHSEKTGKAPLLSEAEQIRKHHVSSKGRVEFLA